MLYVVVVVVIVVVECMVCEIRQPDMQPGTTQSQMTYCVLCSCVVDDDDVVIVIVSFIAFFF